MPAPLSLDSGRLRAVCAPPKKAGDAGELPPLPKPAAPVKARPSGTLPPIAERAGINCWSGQVLDAELRKCVLSSPSGRAPLLPISERLIEQFARSDSHAQDFVRSVGVLNVPIQTGQLCNLLAQNYAPYAETNLQPTLCDFYGLLSRYSAVLRYLYLVGRPSLPVNSRQPGGGTATALRARAELVERLAPREGAPYPLDVEALTMAALRVTDAGGDIGAANKALLTLPMLRRAIDDLAAAGRGQTKSRMSKRDAEALVVAACPLGEDILDAMDAAVDRALAEFGGAMAAWKRAYALVDDFAGLDLGLAVRALEQAAALLAQLDATADWRAKQDVLGLLVQLDDSPGAVLTALGDSARAKPAKWAKAADVLAAAVAAPAAPASSLANHSTPIWTLLRAHLPPGASAGFVGAVVGLAKLAPPSDALLAAIDDLFEAKRAEPEIAAHVAAAAKLLAGLHYAREELRALAPNAREDLPLLPGVDVLAPFGTVPALPEDGGWECRPVEAEAAASFCTLGGRLDLFRRWLEASAYCSNFRAACLIIAAYERAIIAFLGGCVPPERELCLVSFARDPAMRTFVSALEAHGSRRQLASSAVYIPDLLPAQLLADASPDDAPESKAPGPEACDLFGRPLATAAQVFTPEMLMLLSGDFRRLAQHVVLKTLAATDDVRARPEFSGSGLLSPDRGKDDIRRFDLDTRLEAPSSPADFVLGEQSPTRGVMALYLRAWTAEPGDGDRAAVLLASLHADSRE